MPFRSKTVAVSVPAGFRVRRVVHGDLVLGEPAGGLRAGWHLAATANPRSSRLASVATSP